MYIYSLANAEIEEEQQGYQGIKKYIEREAVRAIKRSIRGRVGADYGADNGAHFDLELILNPAWNYESSFIPIISLQNVHYSCKLSNADIELLDAVKQSLSELNINSRYYKIPIDECRYFPDGFTFRFVERKGDTLIWESNRKPRLRNILWKNPEHYVYGSFDRLLLPCWFH